MLCAIVSSKKLYKTFEVDALVFALEQLEKLVMTKPHFKLYKLFTFFTQFLKKYMVDFF
jgi:hypothetical protein